MSDDFSKQLVALADKVNGLLDAASSLYDEGDRAAMFLQVHRTFAQGEATASELVFNVPSDADFFATRLNLYIEARILSLSSPKTETEATYRPVDWTCTADINQFVSGVFPFSPTAVNVLFEMRNDDGPYQNLPTSVLSAFSQRQGLEMWFNQRVSPLVSAYLGGLDFPVDEWVRRGTAVVVKVTPTFVTNPPTPVLGVSEKIEYRVRGVLTGYKRVKAFKTDAYPLTLER